MRTVLVVLSGSALAAAAWLATASAPVPRDVAPVESAVLRDSPSLPAEAPLQASPPPAAVPDGRWDALLDRLTALEERLTRLERLASEDGAARAAAAHGVAALDLADVAAFRLRLEEVERLRREEEAARGVLAQVRSLGAALTAEEETAVVARTLALRDEVRTLGAGARGAADHRDRMEAYERARAAWTRDVRRAVAGEAGERVVAALGRPIGGQWAGLSEEGRPAP
jgi:hypothetical protein